MSVFKKGLFLLIATGVFGFIYADCESHDEELAECMALDDANGGNGPCDPVDYYAIVSDMIDEGCLDIPEP